MSVIKDRLDLLSEVLIDFCTLHDLPEASADDILYSCTIGDEPKLTDYQRDWLRLYISVWDTIAND
tara:strand:+ start:165 stop:362 length:198 start_codon:yes stop_codon:yes gene_type:complete